MDKAIKIAYCYLIAVIPTQGFIDGLLNLYVHHQISHMQIQQNKPEILSLRCVLLFAEKVHIHRNNW